VIEKLRENVERSMQAIPAGEDGGGQYHWNPARLIESAEVLGIDTKGVVELATMLRGGGTVN
jgi:hypothetical protein